MRTSQRFLIWAAIVSSCHFVLAVVLKDARLLLDGPEGVVGTGSGKPFWASNRFSEAMATVGRVIRWPADSIATQSVPDFLLPVVFIFNSCVWGLTITVLIYIVFAYTRKKHSATGGNK
jgi:hypothetical protein